MAEAALIGATKRFGAVTAVAEMDLRVADGEFVVLLGPTGAGKTTTLRLFAGLETPESGRVEIAGQDVTRAAPAQRDVAFVFQQYSLYPHYTVFENLAFPLRAPGRETDAAVIEARVREIAEMLRIGDKMKNRATQLSGGEMQRVSIGRALVRRPNLFLMDEPLSSLDAKLREDLRVELKRIQRDLGATVVYVTHDQLEAMTLADRIGVLSEGRLVQIDAPRAVYERPADIYAAQRLGSPQINLLAPELAARMARDAAGSWPSQAATIGLRPEDVEIRPAAAGAGAAARVLTIEPLGVETIVLIETEDGAHIHALLDPQTRFAEGETVRVAARPGGEILFDTEGRRMEREPTPSRQTASADAPQAQTAPAAATSGGLTGVILDCADAVRAAIVANEAEIEGLDRAIGDGDHYHNIKRGLDTIAAMRPELEGKAPDEALKAIAKKLLMTIGGASGPLSATFFLEMSKAPGASGPTDAAEGGLYDATTLAAMVAAGVAGVMMRGKAERGHKTMLDVLIPVSEAMSEMAAAGRRGREIASALPAIAEAGMLSTKDMMATKGRAAFLGERAVGHIDPGAKSSSVIVATICAALAPRLT